MNTEEIVTMAHIREALGVGHKPMLSEIPGIIQELRERAARAERRVLGGYVCSGCELSCYLNTSGKPFDTETAKCPKDGSATGTNWKPTKPV